MADARRLLGGYALLALLVLPVYPHFQSPNELSRWALVASVVEDRSLSLSPRILAVLGPRFEDLSVFEGRTYSNKAPGAALVALPAYLLARPLIGPPSGENLRPAITAMRWLTSTLPALLLALLLKGGAAALGAPRERARVTPAVLLLGTPVFAYGLLLYAHVLVATCLFGAFSLLFVRASATRVSARWREVGAGALLGLAVLSEYPALLPALVLFTLTALRRDPLRLAAVALGGAPFAILLALYNQACFGSVFQLSSAHEKVAAFSTLAQGGAFGVGFPSPSILARLLFDPSKGLLVLSPILALGALSLRAGFRVLPRDTFLALSLVPLVIVLTYAGYPNWHGGFTVGARYLVSALPFLVLPLALREKTAFESVLMGWSFLAVPLTSLVFPFVPEGFPLPWASFSMPLLADGLILPNLGHLAVRPLGLVLPLAVLVATLAIASHGERPALVALGAALALAVGAAFTAPPLSYPLRMARGYTKEVFLGRRGALADALLPGERLPPRLVARAEQERALAPSDWPF